MTYRIHSVEAFLGKQVILWLEDETTGQRTWDGTEHCVRVTVDKAPALIQELVRAYAETMQNALIEVAAGGCRTCNNTRRVNGVMFQRGSGDPCPKCMPRAEERIRRAVMLPPKERP